MSANTLTCPNCESTQIVKNGRIHNGRQNFFLKTPPPRGNLAIGGFRKCKACSRQFVQNPTKKVIGPETRDLIDKLLLERLSLAGITRVTGVSEQWLQTYVNSKYKATAQQVEVEQKKRGA